MIRTILAFLFSCSIASAGIGVGITPYPGPGVLVASGGTASGFIGSTAAGDDTSTPDYDHSDHGLGTIYPTTTPGPISHCHADTNGTGGASHLNVAVYNAAGSTKLAESNLTAGLGADGVIHFALDSPYTIEAATSYLIAIGNDTPEDYWTVDSTSGAGFTIYEDDTFVIDNTMPTTHDIESKASNYRLRVWCTNTADGT